MDALYPPVEEQMVRLLGWVRKPQPPLHMDLCPTDRCNLSCLFCPNSTAHAMDEGLISGEIPDNRWLEIVEEGLELGVWTWRIVGGGEPMLRRDLVLSMVEMIKAYSSETTCELHTNASLFTEDSIKRLVAAGIDTITVSLDGASEEVHDKLKAVPGTFRQVMRALKRFKELRKEMKTDKPLIKFHTVLCSLNVHEVENIVSFAADYGVSVIELFAVQDYGLPAEEFESLRLRPDDLKSLSRRSASIVGRAREAGVYIVKDADYLPGEGILLEDNYHRYLTFPKKPVLREGAYPRCLEPWYVMFIDSKGRVGPCCVAGNDVGDSDARPLIQEVSLAEAWQDRFLQDVRDTVYSDTPLRLCEVCPIKASPLVRDIVRTLDGRCGGRWRPLHARGFRYLLGFKQKLKRKIC